GIVMGVVHMRAGIRYGELVRIGLTGLDRRLGDEGNTVLVVWQFQAVKVDSGRFRQLVLERHANAISFPNANLWTGDLIVVRPGLDRLAGRSLPTNFPRRQLEDFHPIPNSRLK